MRGRAARGKRAVRIIDGLRGPNFTLILTVFSRLGVIYHEFFQGGTTAERFNARLQTASEAAGDSDSTLIFDNPFCHRRFLQAALSNNQNANCCLRKIRF